MVIIRIAYLYTIGGCVAKTERGDNVGGSCPD